MKRRVERLRVRAVALFLLTFYGLIFGLFLTPALCPHMRKQLAQWHGSPLSQTAGLSASACRETCHVAPHSHEERTEVPAWQRRAGKCPFVLLVLTPNTTQSAVVVERLGAIADSGDAPAYPFIELHPVPLAWSQRAPPLGAHIPSIA
jgi:hypothetical protein